MEIDWRRQPRAVSSQRCTRRYSLIEEERQMDGMGRQRPTSHRIASDEQMFAAQAAAELLGIHRSTLYLAVRKSKLIPDAYTPGGHARFRWETLERFRERLTLDSATGGGGSISRAVASAIASLSHFTKLQPVCEAVVEAALIACPGFETCLAVAHDDYTNACNDLRLLAERGLPQRLRQEYHWLRRRPGLDFISSMVARQQEPYFCYDIQLERGAAPEGGWATLTNAGFHSCAALPCVHDGVTLGLLICLGRAPCSASEPEMVALRNLADVLTVALRRQRRDEATLRQTTAISELMRQTQLAQSGVTSADDLGAARRICQQGARARVVQEWGIASASTPAPAPLANLLRAAASTETPQRVEWAEDDGGRIALAIPAQAQDGHAAVGAIWLRQDLCSGMEVTLLQVYAQVCSAIASR
jgi:hypothetical protein